MENWQAIVQSRIVSPDEAISKIRSGDKVFLTSNCSVPKTLLRSLVTHSRQIKDVELYQGLTVADSDYVAPELQGHLRVNTIFNSPNVRQAVNSGRADFSPVLLSEWPLLFRNQIWPVDIALAQVSLPNQEGFCSFGIATGIAKTPVESAKWIIAEINEQMPPMPGDTLIPIERLDSIVPVSYPADEFPMGSSNPSREIKQIAANVAGLIPDGATLQIGIGEIPNAVLMEMRGKKDLGIHSETFSDSMIELVENGVVNGARKSIHPGKLVAGFLLGTRKFYQWASQHPLIELHPTEYVNNPLVIARNNRMAAINSAIEVDFTGQVCADSIGPLIYSGVGGQMDFIYGASLSAGSFPVIAMTSTARLKDGSTVSRIVSTLQPGAGVTISRNHVRYIATEYGVVNLYGKSIRERSQLLISIAHPDFRDLLIYEANKLNYI